jgi:MFS transporter, FHS family, L-fucose permease
VLTSSNGNMTTYTSDTIARTRSVSQQGLFNTADGKNLVVPFVLITSLFLLWGFCNGMIDILNKHFQDTLGINKEQSGLVQAANYLAYFVMAIPAGVLAKRFGYKRGIIVGLLLIACGALWFIPATNIGTYWAFLLGLFVIAAGMTCLETIANPYATVLGTPETGPTRINIAQTMNGLGWILGPMVGGYFVFSRDQGTRSSSSLSTPYVGIGLFVVLLLIIFALSNIPELHVEDSSRAASEQERLRPTGVQLAAIAVALGAVCGVLYFFIVPILKLLWTVFYMNEALLAAVQYSLLVVAYLTTFLLVSRNWDLFRRKHFTLGVGTQFLYVAAQSGIFSFCVNYVLENDPGLTRLQASKWLGIIGFGLFMIGRLCGSAIISQFRPNRVLALYAAINVGLVAITMGGGKVGLVAMFASFFFMSIGFPTIFALGIRGLGEHTKFASSLIVMSIVGGAIAPPFMGHIADRHSMRSGFVVPLICFVFVSLYGLAWKRLYAQGSQDATEVIVPRNSVLVEEYD